MKAIGFADTTLWAIRWEVAGRDVILRVELGDGTRVDLCCTWTRNLVCSVAKKADHGGPFLSCNGSVDAAHDGTYEVWFDFASGGRVSLKCNDVTVAGW